jgi:copper chaperone CopZ
MKSILFIATIALFSFTTKNCEIKEVVIKTSAECDMCKEVMEEKLNYTKGITYVNLEVSSKLLTVKYKEDKISLEKIREIISNLGYDADEIKANSEKQQSLPSCCRPDGMK